MSQISGQDQVTDVLWTRYDVRALKLAQMHLTVAFLLTFMMLLTAIIVRNYIQS